MEKMFEKLTRKKVRFVTKKGTLSIEDVWDLPLTHLNELAKELFKKVTEDSMSFIDTVKKDELTELKFEAIKHVINVRLDDVKEAEKKAEKADKKTKLIDALASKEEDDLKGMSKKAIKKAISEL